MCYFCTCMIWELASFSAHNYSVGQPIIFDTEGTIMDIKKIAIGLTAALLITQPALAQDADDDDQTVLLAPNSSGPQGFAGLGGAESGVVIGGAIAFAALLAIIANDSSSTTTTPTAAPGS